MLVLSSLVLSSLSCRGLSLSLVLVHFLVYGKNSETVSLWQEIFFLYLLDFVGGDPHGMLEYPVQAKRYALTRIQYVSPECQQLFVRTVTSGRSFWLSAAIT